MAIIVGHHQRRQAAAAAAVGKDDKGGGSLFLYGVVVEKMVCAFYQFNVWQLGWEIRSDITKPNIGGVNSLSAMDSCDRPLKN